jgi:hypothetical protein
MQYEVRIDGISGNDYNFNDFSKAFFFVIEKCKELNILSRNIPSRIWDGSELVIYDEYKVMHTFSITNKSQNSLTCYLKIIPAMTFLDRIQQEYDEGFVLESITKINYRNNIPTQFCCLFVKI